MARAAKRRQIELGWFETAVLVVGYVASLAIVGVTGIYVGQRTVQQRLGEKNRAIRLPVADSGEQSGDGATEPRGEPAITFYEKLGKAVKEPSEEKAIFKEGRISKNPVFQLLLQKLLFGQFGSLNS